MFSYSFIIRESSSGTEDAFTLRTSWKLGYFLQSSRIFHPLQEIRAGAGVALGPSEGRRAEGKMKGGGGEGFAEGLSLGTTSTGSSKSIDDGPATGLT